MSVKHKSQISKLDEKGEIEIDSKCRPSNAKREISLTLAGIDKAFKLEPANAFFDIRCNREAGSNAIDTSDLHPEKQHSPMISTDPGIETDVTIVPEKQLSPIDDNCDSLSNVIVASEQQSEKHDEPRDSTDAGREIDIKPLRENAFAPMDDNFELQSKATD
jgi:hypothetical protein